MKLEETLDRMSDTVSLVSRSDLTGLSDALVHGRGKVAVAIASDEFGVIARYFARCRTTLGHGVTLVVSPLEFVLGVHDWSDMQIWLFGADCDHPDLCAALLRASRCDCESVALVARQSPDAARAHRDATIFAVPLAWPERHGVAAHATIAMVAALLLACDRTIECPHGEALADVFVDAVRTAPPIVREHPEALDQNELVIVPYDPQAAAVAEAIATCLSRTGLTTAELCDLHDFVSARHLLISRKPERSLVISVTTCETDPYRASIRALLPPQVRWLDLSSGDGGRLAIAKGIAAGIAIALQLSSADEGEQMHGGESTQAPADQDRLLIDLATDLTAPVEHKARARLLHDQISDRSTSIRALGRDRLRALRDAKFVGVVLDYDGTVVPNEPHEARFEAPAPEIIGELTRLVDDGLPVGFATGRGASAGDILRAALPERVHDHILVGYFNGAQIRPLGIDIRNDPAVHDHRIAQVTDWLMSSRLLARDAHIFSSHSQVTISRDSISDPNGFAQRIAACPAVADGGMRLLRSHHTFDIIPAETTKLAVMDHIAELSGNPEGPVLGIGDSGSPLGNDYEMLSRPHAISVNRVCGHDFGSWTVFGSAAIGPAAVLRILEATSVCHGLASIDVERLGIGGRI